MSGDLGAIILIPSLPSGSTCSLPLVLVVFGQGNLRVDVESGVEVMGVTGVRVLHTADLHLEWPFALSGADRLRGRLRRTELKEIFAAIIDLARTEQVQVLLIAGDLFEHQHATRGTAKFLDEQFRRIPKTRIFISPGNHDPFLATSLYATYPWPQHVHVFGPQVERVDLPDLPVSIYGWGFPDWEVPGYMLGALQVADPSRINLVVVHGGEGAYHPFRPADLARIGADYIALGHIHKEEVVLTAPGGRVLARYCGSPEALNFGEPGQHGVLLGTVSKVSTRLEFMPTGRRQYVTASVDATGAVSSEDLLRLVTEVDSAESRAQNSYRVSLTGSVDPDLTIDLSVLQERLAPEFYLLKLQDATSPGFDLDRLAQERTARGLFVQQLLAMEQAQTDPGAQQRIRRALSVGLLAFEQRGGAR